MSCQTCRFFHEEKSNEIAECRRRAPTVMRNPEDADILDSFWPDVEPDDWCGEFESRVRLTLPTEQDEIIMRNLRGAGIMIGALMRRLGVDELRLTSEELVSGPSAHDVTIEDDPVEGDRTIRIRRGG